MTIIDAHIHYGDDDPDFLRLLEELDIKLLNITLVQSHDSRWREQADRYRDLAQRYPQRFSWCTSIDLPRFDDPDYANFAILGLDRDFENKAVACKIWKNIGMEVKNPAGDYVMIDDPIFAPIFKHIAARGRALLLHIAEPLACWQPLDENNPHYGYYSRNPQWHMYGKSDVPSHADLIAARDRVVEKNLNLRIIGAHLGSLEHDVDEVAKRLDAYPNFAVDISARLADLARQDSSKVRQFFIDYQDRILFGTDMVMGTPISQMAPAEKAEALARIRETYEMHFAYLEKSGPVTVRGYETEGLHLPPEVLEKVYRRNAQRWYAGV
ncbi:amidohydrolase [Litorilinea aerophila]|uniref:amidohydrolase family protein n=1 Tax=Litorilinea aerophila TaxID=1204385 RepID=UPI001476D188|nr:amidohydrolase family protein [Litorilinea aerophila]MCC9075687.1 amidohydrolase [Litorilinea aerophila]